jgi:uncharacterized LabA/DUF88 family protein
MNRVAVFIDYQNTYMRARTAFGDVRLDPFTFGQVFPRRLAVLLKQKGEEADPTRTLVGVRVYRGEPDAQRSPVGQAACQRQVRFWNAQKLVTAITRPLHYLETDWNSAGAPTKWLPREKGIDVLLAIDMAMGAVQDEYDTAVLMSADTDLVPALEAVLELGKRVEVASWRPESFWGSRLTVPGRNVWCHWLSRQDFEMVRDDADYTQPVDGPPPTV